jgi:hypothetical protein
VKLGTYLTVDWRRSVHTNETEYRANKARKARRGVNLSSEQISSGGRGNQSEELIATDPYRPPVGDMAPKDLPFVVEGSEELPPTQLVSLRYL